MQDKNVVGALETFLAAVKAAAKEQLSIYSPEAVNMAWKLAEEDVCFEWMEEERMDVAVKMVVDTFHNLAANC